MMSPRRGPTPQSFAVPVYRGFVLRGRPETAARGCAASTRPPCTGELDSIVPVGDDPTGITTGGGAVWVGDEDGVIRRIDENTRQVTEIPFGSEIRGLAYDEEADTLWVDVAGPF